MKKILSVLLAFCLLVGCLPLAAGATGEEDGNTPEQGGTPVDVFDYEIDNFRVGADNKKVFTPRSEIRMTIRVKDGVNYIFNKTEMEKPNNRTVKFLNADGSQIAEGIPTLVSCEESTAVIVFLLSESITQPTISISIALNKAILNGFEGEIAPFLEEVNIAKFSPLIDLNWIGSNDAPGIKSGQTHVEVHLTANPKSFSFDNTNASNTANWIIGDDSGLTLAYVDSVNSQNACLVFSGKAIAGKKLTIQAKDTVFSAGSGSTGKTNTIAIPVDAEPFTPTMEYAFQNPATLKNGRIGILILSYNAEFDLQGATAKSNWEIDLGDSGLTTESVFVSEFSDGRKDTSGVWIYLTPGPNAKSGNANVKIKALAGAFRDVPEGTESNEITVPVMIESVPIAVNPGTVTLMTEEDYAVQENKTELTSLQVDNWPATVADAVGSVSFAAPQKGESDYDYTVKVTGTLKYLTEGYTVHYIENEQESSITYHYLLPVKISIPEAKINKYMGIFVNSENGKLTSYTNGILAGKYTTEENDYIMYTFDLSALTLDGEPNKPVVNPDPGPTTPSTPSTPTPKDEVTPTPTVSGGTASTTVSSSDGASLVEAAKQPSTSEVTVKVDTTQDVTAANVTLPASTVNGVGAAKADLKVETPVADITLPSAALTNLSTGAGSVTVSTAVNSDKTVSIDVKKDNTVVKTLAEPLRASIPDKSVTGSTVAVLVDENGKETIIPKSISGKDEMNLLLSGSGKIKLKDNAKTFNDTQGHWAANDGSIGFATSRELFQGTGDGAFSPDTTMTRGMIVTVLHRLESKPKGGSVSFGDVSADAYFAEAVAWGNANDIVKGDGSNFQPDDNVTREQLATFLYRYAGKYGVDTTGRTNLTSFPDSGNVNSYAKDALEWAYHTGLIKGGSDGKLNPTGSAKRGEVAAILMRFVEYINK